MIVVGINGFGRIGRNFLRAVLKDRAAQDKIKVAAINIGPARIEYVAHMFEYDTLMGTYPGKVAMEGDKLIVDDYAIQILNVHNPLHLDWQQYAVDWVVEASGMFTKAHDARQHLEGGAKHVLITAPAHGEDITIVPGVNEDKFDSAKHTIVSLGSCTTNAFIPILDVMHQTFTIQQGFMTTVHAYTNTQVLLDVECDDLRRSRAAALNIIPTTTGAQDMVGKIIPSLSGTLSATAIRVPVGKVSLIDVCIFTQKEVTVDAIHQAFGRMAQGRMRGIVDLTLKPLVSSDFSGNNYSVVIDGLLTQAQGNMAKVFGWYDNEWGYSVRLKDFLLYVGKLS